ncbi:DNA-binding protein [Cellulomonas sp. Root137]|uniref:DNA-binding protein n=1 Tax=Cellulomonas sp. Root137 TaxID=1736459 RepID=UPI000AA992C4|nr:DNA-binding protein [Cellulomonas sp. Root137]
MDPLPPGLGKPATRALALARIATLDDVRDRDLDDLLQLHGVGPKAIRILREALAASS